MGVSVGVWVGVWQRGCVGWGEATRGEIGWTDGFVVAVGRVALSFVTLGWGAQVAGGWVRWVVALS